MTEDNNCYLEDETILQRLKEIYYNEQQHKKNQYKKGLLMIRKKVSSFESFEFLERRIRDILIKALIGHSVILNNPDSGNIAYLYIQARRDADCLWMMENRDFKNILHMSQISHITDLGFQILYAYCNKSYYSVPFNNESGLVVEGDTFIDARNTIYYNGNKYKLSYEQLLIAPECNDIFIKIEKI